MIGAIYSGVVRVGLAVLGAALAVAPAGAQLKPAELPVLLEARGVAARPQARPTETIRYGEAPSQTVELFLPKADNEGKIPVVVMLHGGCWQSGVGGPALMHAAAGAFVEKGLAVWNIGYRRLGDDGGGYPGTFADVGMAFDLLREHADAHNLDLGRVVGFGHSAGGLLALWAAGRHKLPAQSALHVESAQRLRGVVSVGGLGDMQGLSRHIDAICGDATVTAMTVGLPAPTDSTDAEPAAPRANPFADTSPAALLPTGTPVVMLHGVYDATTPPAFGLMYAQQARKAGDRADVQVAPNAGHYEVIAPGTRAFDQALAAVERFAR